MGVRLLSNQSHETLVNWLSGHLVPKSRTKSIHYTLSKALEKTSKIMFVCLPTLAFLVRSSMSMMSWVSHNLFSLKPWWRSYKIHCPSRCLTLFEAKMCSSTLQMMQVRENGSVVCCQSFVTFFEDRHDICFHPVCRELICL